MSQDTIDTIESSEVSRTATGERVLITLLFAIILHLVGVVLTFVVLFELVYALISKGRPTERVPRFANRLIRYGYEIGQYMTYNSDQPPFPFKDLPNGSESPLAVGH